VSNIGFVSIGLTKHLVFLQKKPKIVENKKIKNFERKEKQWPFLISPNLSMNYFGGISSVWMPFLLNMVIATVNGKF